MLLRQNPGVSLGFLSSAIHHTSTIERVSQVMKEVERNLCESCCCRDSCCTLFYRTSGELHTQRKGCLDVFFLLLIHRSHSISLTRVRGSRRLSLPPSPPPSLCAAWCENMCCDLRCPSWTWRALTPGFPQTPLWSWCSPPWCARGRQRQVCVCGCVCVCRVCCCCSNPAPT